MGLGLKDVVVLVPEDVEFFQVRFGHIRGDIPGGVRPGAAFFVGQRSGPPDGFGKGGDKAIVISLPDRIVFVVIAAGATNRHPQHGRAHGRRHIVKFVVAVSLEFLYGLGDVFHATAEPRQPKTTADCRRCHGLPRSADRSSFTSIYHRTDCVPLGVIQRDRAGVQLGRQEGVFVFNCCAWRCVIARMCVFLGVYGHFHGT